MSDREFKDFLASIHLNFSEIEASGLSLVVEFEVLAKPGSKKERLFVEEGKVVVACHARAVDGGANKRITKMLAKGMGLAGSHLQIVSGEKSKNKRFRAIFNFSDNRPVNYYREKMMKSLI